MLKITILGKVKELYLSYKYNNCSIFLKSCTLVWWIFHKLFDLYQFGISLLLTGIKSAHMDAASSPSQISITVPLKKQARCIIKDSTLSSHGLFYPAAVWRKRYCGIRATTRRLTISSPGFLWFINCVPFQGNPTRDLICQSVAV